MMHNDVQIHLLKVTSHRLEQQIVNEYILACLAQLLALCTDPESHNTQRHRQTDRGTDGQTDDMMMPIADRILCSNTIG